MAAQIMSTGEHPKDEQHLPRDVVAGDTLDLNSVLSTCQMSIPDMAFSEYDDFKDDLQMVEMTPADLTRELGLSKNTVYAWGQFTIPDYAKAYLQLRMELYDYRLRYGEL